MSEEVIQNQREAFVAQMRQRVDITHMKQVMLDGLVTGLSARELRAAARPSSPVDAFSPLHPSHAFIPANAPGECRTTSLQAHPSSF